MTDVVIRRIFEDRGFIDMLNWCDKQFGNCAWPHMDNLNKNKPWGVCSLQGKTVFRFYRPDDATLFKLTWVSDEDA